MRSILSKRTLVALGLSMAIGTTAHAALPSGISGAWYNPEQSGHGLSVKILSPDRALVFWYTYDAAGNPFNLYIDGRIEGRRIEATALAPRGMRFGSFDPDELDKPAWGTVGIEFDDCNRGRLNWQADDPAFGSGGFDIMRLTSPYTQTCELGDAGLPARGIFEVDIATTQIPGTQQTSSGIAAIDSDGKLWALEKLNLSGPTELVPGPTYLGPNLRVVSALVGTGATSSSTVFINQTINLWARYPSTAYAPSKGEWTSTADGGKLVYRDPVLGFQGSLSPPQATWTLRRSNADLVRPLRVERLARSYAATLRGQFFELPASIAFESDGSLCLRRYPEGQPTDPCRLVGRYWLADAEQGFLDFELTDVDTVISPKVAYRGRGWLQSDGQGDALIMVGDDGYTGFGLIAR